MPPKNPQQRALQRAYIPLRPLPASSFLNSPHPGHTFGIAHSLTYWR